MRKRILVVDDEEEVVSTIKMLLESTKEYEVRTMTEAKDIISSVHAFHPDVILLDLLMPDTGGMEVCQMLNNDSLGATIPIIILSGLGKDIDKQDAYKLGVVDYLVKPVSRNDLIAGVEKAIKLKSETD